MFYMNDLQIHSEKFTTMMLLDDCFIVGLFMKYREDEALGDPLLSCQ